MYQCLENKFVALNYVCCICILYNAKGLLMCFRFYNIGLRCVFWCLDVI